MSNDKKVRTKYYFTDYVNHMIRFYLGSPDSLPLEGKTASSVANWCAVQRVLYKLPEPEQVIVRTVFAPGTPVPKAVKDYCKANGTDEQELWGFVTKLVYKIAKARGLV